jgi:hypothetical protein
MACSLSARGKSFDVDAFLAASSLEPSGIWRKGESIGTGTGTSAKRHEYSGFSVRVSASGRADFDGQLRDVRRFLRRQQAELKRLRQARGVKDLWLDFGVMWSDVAVHVDAFPADLVEAAGRVPLILSISHYRA